MADLELKNLLISASQVAGITGMSRQYGHTENFNDRTLIIHISMWLISSPHYFSFSKISGYSYLLI
jgi:hypothetical protein